jgi:hypothetical protein
MPTSYTDRFLSSKEPMPLRDWALICARAFGACAHMRDEDMDVPAPKKIEPSDHHIEGLKKAKAELAKFKKMTKTQQKAYDAKAYKETLASLIKSRNKNQEVDRRHNEMRIKVQEWLVPPELDNLKNFMLDQIDISDGHMTDYYEREIARLQKTGHYAAALESAKGSVKYHQEGYAKECEGIRKCNEWLAALYKSLPPKG